MATAKKTTDTIWIGELDRFGYTLTVAGKSEKEVRDALSKEYIRAYKQINGSDPRKERTYYHDDKQTYYDSAMEDINIYEMHTGKVEWK